MHQSRFEAEASPRWQRLERLLDELPGRRLSARQKAELEEMPALYRQVCSDYGLALKRRYTTGLAGRLHTLVLRGHHLIYQQRGQGLRDLIRFIGITFPCRVRRAWRFVALSLAFFLLPALVLGYGAYRDDTFVYSLMPASEVRNMEKMYSNQKLIEQGRGTQGDAAMFGYYIEHNIGIGFQCFAGGLFFGLGSVFFLSYNGMILGGVAGHLSHPPYAASFWPYVAGHCPWELSAVVLCGAAGLMLGLRLVQPGPLRRVDALRQIAPQAVQLVLGGALMLVLAAAIEAFWSALPLSAAVKYGFSALNWCAVLGYLCLSGRGHAA